MADSQRRASDAGGALTALATDWVARSRSTRAESADAGVAGALPRAAHVVAPELGWQQAEAAALLQEELAPVIDELHDLRDQVGVARAAVKVVDEARATAEDLRAEAVRREDDCSRAEAARAARQSRHDEAVTGAIEVAENLSAALANWLAAPGAVPVARPAITAEALAVFPSVVDDAVAPVRSDTEQRRAEVRARLAAAEAERRQVTVEREAVASKQDPRPMAPAWHRGDRAQLEAAGGAPFWQLVDFHDDVAEPVRSAVEAALGASGLLDAWVSPDGRR